MKFLSLIFLLSISSFFLSSLYSAEPKKDEKKELKNCVNNCDKKLKKDLAWAHALAVTTGLSHLALFTDEANKTFDTCKKDCEKKFSNPKKID